MSTLLNPAWQQQQQQNQQRWAKSKKKERIGKLQFVYFRYKATNLYTCGVTNRVQSAICCFFISHRVRVACERVSPPYSSWQRSIWNSSKSIIISHSTILAHWADKPTMINPKNTRSATCQCHWVGMSLSSIFVLRFLCTLINLCWLLIWIFIIQLIENEWADK